MQVMTGWAIVVSSPRLDWHARLLLDPRRAVHGRRRA
jgi:hypothetical protein